MNKMVWLPIAALAVLAESAGAAPIEAYARLPLYENVAISPNGQKIAFVTTVGDKREAIIQSLVDKEDVVRIGVGNRKLRNVVWPSADHLLAYISKSTDFFAGSQSEIVTLGAYDLGRKKVVYPLEFPRTHSVAFATVRGETLPVTTASAVFRGTGGMYRIDFAKQTLTMLDAPSWDFGFGFSWLVSPEGQLYARTSYDEPKKRWALYLLKDGNWIEVQAENAALDYPRIVGIGPEEGVITINRIIAGELVPTRLSLVDGKWSDALPKEWQGDRYLSDRKTGYLVGAVKYDTKRHYVFFDPERQNTWDRIVRQFAGVDIELESWSDDWQKIVVRFFGTGVGVGYALIDTSTHQVSNLGNLYANVEAADIAQVKPISYMADDGLQIGGYLTFPRAKLAKNMPLIVMPHGGPNARNVFEFEWFAQALASKGYLILQPNFRGSWGLGEKFKEAGYGEWGRKMQSDLSDGVRALVKLGIVDPRRVCIVGWSYGGYAALAGAMMESDVYRCAASMAGISDLKKAFYENVDGLMIRDNVSLRNDLRYVGAKNLNDPVLAERSPALHADKVSIPVLLIHGDNDSVVPFEQSQIMANALKKAGKPYEFVKLKSEDHWLSKADTRLQMLQAVVKFLETNNPP